MTIKVEYQVATEAWAGPFDLLLKAIDDGEVDIHQILLSQIVDSYLLYWRQQAPGLVVASDFIYSAAYLLEKKSRAMLPAKEEFAIEEDLSGVEESLVAHIQEYQLFKNMAQTLRERKEVFEKIFGRHEGEAEEKEIELVDVSLKDLVQAFKRAYDEAARRESVVSIPAEEITLESRIEEVRRLLSGRREGVSFVNLFIRRTRLEIVVTFLAILELAKQTFLKIVQGGRFAEITIFSREVFEEEYGDTNTNRDADPAAAQPA